jgi:quercetin dioxygenase-like cupin family protein
MNRPIARSPVRSPARTPVRSSVRLDIAARVVDGGDFETISLPTDEIRLRVTDAGDVQVTDYESTDRIGPPAHSHPWHEVEYVIDGTVEFLVEGAWLRGGPGTVQMLPAGSPHSVRVPVGTARLLMVTIGAPYDAFARDLAALHTGDPSASDVLAVALRHGLRPA